jgi:hypothetical protein
VQAELATLPINSPASGFTYRLDRQLGATVRSSDSFGPFFTERSLSTGRLQASFGTRFSQADYSTIDGRALRDGTLVATASRLAGDDQAFDAETLTLRIQTRTTTFSGHIGLTDRLDVSAALPLVTMNMDGERVDTYRGSSFVQATATASVTGIGDLIVSGKYNILRSGASGLAVGVEGRFATGDEENLIGGGVNIVTPRAIVSIERDRLALHGNVGYAMGGGSRALDYSGAISVVAHPRLTLVAEILGRQLPKGNGLVDAVAPHPDLAGVETIRLVAVPQSTNRTSIVAGLRWNVAARWLLGGYVLRPITTTGLNARWVSSVTFDYSFGG